jgi:bifunctional DNA-binding transcriptional regulator/antitoxin component of YhaV-PrlF toxin-antitoxin module
METSVKVRRRRGYTRLSAKHQVTIPIDTLAQAGLRTGDRLRAEVRGPGEVVLVREIDPLTQFAGALTDVYPTGELEELRLEWP